MTHTSKREVRALAGDGLVVVDGILGNCLISVYAINCDWEVGVYGREAGRGAPEPGGTAARLGDQRWEDLAGIAKGGVERDIKLGHLTL